MRWAANGTFGMARSIGKERGGAGSRWVSGVEDAVDGDGDGGKTESSQELCHLFTPRTMYARALCHRPSLCSHVVLPLGLDRLLPIHAWHGALSRRCPEEPGVCSKQKERARGGESLPMFEEGTTGRCELFYF